MRQNISIHSVFVKLCLLLFSFGVVIAQPTSGQRGQLVISDLSGGENTSDFPSNLQDNEALLIQNLIYKNNVMQGRKGYANYNTTSLGNLRPKGLHRAGNKNLYLAYNGYLWKNLNTAETSFVKVDSTPDTLASANYVNFIDFSDTTYFVDGRNFWKTAGDSLIRGNVVASGAVTKFIAPTTLLGFGLDTLELPISDGTYIRRANSTAVFCGPDVFPIGNDKGSPAAGLIHIDLTDLESTDGVTNGICSLFVTRYYTSPETLEVRSAEVSWSCYGVSWSSKPTVGSVAYGTVVISNTGWHVVSITSWADSVAKGLRANHGLYLVLADTVTNSNAKWINWRTSRVNLKVSKILPSPNARISSFVDTAYTWDINRWQNYFVEFVSEAGTDPNYNYVRLIDSVRYDTIFFEPPVADPKFWTTGNGVENYRIVALPTTQDNIWTGTVDSVTVDNGPYQRVRVWDTQPATVSTNDWTNKTYWFVVTEGAGRGRYLILKNTNGASSADYILVFGRKFQFNTATKYEIQQSRWPPVKYFTVRANQAVFGGDSLHPSWVWWSEPKVLGEVGGLNFKPIGGEVAEGNITAVKTLFSGRFNDPLNPVLYYKPQSLSADFGQDISTSIPIKILDRFGTVANSSIISVEGNQYFQAPDKNFYVTDGQQIKLLSNKLKVTLDSLADSTLYRTAGFYYDRNIYWSVKQNSGSGYKTLAYNIDNGSWTEHNFRFGQATHINLANDTLAPIVFTNPDTAKVYKFGKAQNDPGSVNIIANVKTKWYDMGSPDWFKKGISARSQAYSLGSGAAMRAVLYRDYSSTVSDSVTFNESGYDNVLRYFRNSPVGKHFQLRFTAYAGNFNFGEVRFGFVYHHREGI